MTFRLPTVSALALVAAIPATAIAQESDENIIIVTAQADNASIVLNSGDAGVLGDLPAEDLPFSIRSYDESLILNQQPQTLGDVLENDPTIRTTFGFGNAAEQFVIRGFALFGDDVGLNGLYGIAPRQLVAPELFDSVQVLNGASAFLNGAAPGSSGVGGSVNLKLKRAGAETLSRATGSFTGDSQFGGSMDVSRRFGSDGSTGVRLNAAYRSGELAIDREDRETLVIGGAVDINRGPLRAALDLAYQEVRVDALRPKVTLATAAIPRVPDQSANYAQDFSYSELRDVFGTLLVEYDIDDQAMLYAKAGARDGREEGIYSSITVNDALTGAATGGALFVPRTDNNEAVEVGLRAILGETVTHTINLGANINWQTNRNAYDFLGGFAGFPTNLYTTPQIAVPESGFVGGDLDDPYPIAETRLWSVFASDTVSVLGDRILLTGGLRLQSIRQRSFDYIGGMSPSSVYDETAVTPAIGLVIKPAANISLFANRIDALGQGPVAPIEQVTNPGEALAPRRSKQYEIGGKARFGGLFASLAAYQIERPGELTVDGRFQYGGIQRHRGVEFTLNGELSPGLRLIAGASVTDAEFVDGNKVAGVADFAANANLEWDVPFATGLTLTGRAVHTSDQWVDAQNTLEIDGWTRFDAGMRYVFVAGDRPVTVRATVDNVGNARYWASAFDSFSSAVLQGRPRTMKASASFDF